MRINVNGVNAAVLDSKSPEVRVLVGSEVQEKFVTAKVDYLVSKIIPRNHLADPFRSVHPDVKNIVLILGVEVPEGQLQEIERAFDQPMAFSVTVVVVGIVWGKDCAIFSSQSSPAIRSRFRHFVAREAADTVRTDTVTVWTDKSAVLTDKIGSTSSVTLVGLVCKFDVQKTRPFSLSHPGLHERITCYYSFRLSIS